MKVLSNRVNLTAVSTAVSVLLGLFCLTSQAEIVIGKSSISPVASISATDETVRVMGGLTLVTQQGGERFESLDKAYTDYTRGNYAKSYEIFDYYAKNNNLHAVLATGYFLFMGYGVEQDYVKAKSYLDRAGKSGFARAFYLLGLLEKNKAKTQQFSLVAERLLNKAADMGDPVATNALANQYYQRGDLNKAISWNEKAIQLGSRAAKRNQQVISSGSNTKVISVPSANNDALAQLRKSSAEGNAQASYELATRYHKGVGVNVNFGEAIRLYRVAAGQGSDAARKILPVLLSKQSTTGGINSMWMQQTSNMIAMPPVILADKENKGSSTYSVGATRQQVSLDEDDPLDNLLNLIPTSSN